MRPRAIDLNGPAMPNVVGVMVLLDRSGSMGSIKTDMEKAFQDFLDEQRALDSEGLWVSLYQFDSQGSYSGLSFDTSYERRPLADVPRLELTPRGNTPLNDALVAFADRAKAVVDDPADDTERLLLVVITDGGENASTVHSRKQAIDRLDALKSDDCEVIWIGEQTVIEQAVNQGYVPTTATAGWGAGGIGDVNVAVRSLSAASANYRTGQSAGDTMSSYVASVSSGVGSDGSDTYEESAKLLRARASTRATTKPSTTA